MCPLKTIDIDANIFLYLEGEPYYPDTVSISSTGAAAVRADDMGLYKRMKDVYQRGRPVYKQENGVRYIYCNSKYILLSLFFIDCLLF